MGLESSRTERFLQITNGVKLTSTEDSLCSKTVVNAMFRFILTELLCITVGAWVPQMESKGRQRRIQNTVKHLK